MNSNTKSVIKVVLWVILIILIFSSISALFAGYAGSKVGNIIESELETRTRGQGVNFNPMKTVGNFSYIFAAILLVIAFLTYYFGIRKL
jgi:hypothetical protein